MLRFFHIFPDKAEFKLSVGFYQTLFTFSWKDCIQRGPLTSFQLAFMYICLGVCLYICVCLCMDLIVCHVPLWMSEDNFLGLSCFSPCTFM